MTASKRVLFVHDDPADLRRVGAEMAAQLPNVQVIPVTTAQALAEELQSGHFDLVLTLSHLSWTDGLAVLRAVRSRPPHRPVVLLSLAPDLDMMAAGLRYGLDGAFVSHSSALSGLAEVVSRAWDRPPGGRGEAMLDESHYTLILQDLCSATGPEFFRALVRRLAETFDVRRAFVSEVVGERATRVRLIAASSDRDYKEGLEYDLAGTPCETVVGKARGHYPEGLQSLFPNDAWIRTHGIHSYFAEPIFDRAGRPLGHFGMMSDQPLDVHPSYDRLLWVLQARAAGELMRRKEEERLSYRAQHDALTGLANRQLFLDRLHQAMVRSNWHRVLVAVMLCDLDRFKLVSEALSQPLADRILRSVAERLEGCVREGDTVAHMGGKEFGLLLVDVAEADHIPPIARKILRAFSQPFQVEDQQVLLGANIGISVYPGDGEDAETLLRCAEAATFQAGSQPNEYRFYTGAMNVKAAERLKLENAMRRAIEQQEFELHYQPQVDLITGKTTGLEALIRWQSPERGLVCPVEFIPLLEETGLILTVGEWVLRTACAKKKDWWREGLDFPRLSVNLSGRQLNDPGLIGTVGRVLDQTRIDPRSVELEITESMIQDAEVAARILEELSEMGLTLAIDDFGTGYSSLSYLKAFPVDTLKIDKSFVHDITTDPNDAAIAKAIIGMAHNLEMKVIAEGVETTEQFDFLSLQKCDEIQGFLLGRPLAAADVSAYLQRHQMS